MLGHHLNVDMYLTEIQEGNGKENHPFSCYSLRTGSAALCSALKAQVANPVLGVIESGKFTVTGGLIACCCSLYTGTHCLYRVQKYKHVVAIVNSTHCHLCRDSSCSSTRMEHNLDDSTIMPYLRAVFQLQITKARQLFELLSELMHSQDKSSGNPALQFTGSSNLCAVGNVTHISSLALKILLEFDKEFVWGDNLIFNTATLGCD